MKTKQSFIHCFLSELHRQNIDYVILRNYDNLFDNTLKDLDILYNTAQERLLIRIIQQVCQSESCQLYLKNNSVARMLYTVLTENGDIVYLDLSKYINLKSNPFSLNHKGIGVKVFITDISKKTIESSGIAVNIPDEKYEILFLINHLSKKYKPEYYIKINDWLLKNNYPVISNYQNKTERFAILKKIVPEEKFSSAVRQCFMNIKVFILHLLLDRLYKYRNTVLIYYSGPDGAGKSTTYLNTMELFKRVGIQYYPLRSLQVGIQYYQYLKRKSGKNIQKGDSKFNNVGRLGYSNIPRNRDNGTLYWKFRRFCGLLVGILDIVLLGRLLVFSKRLKGQTVIVEESPIDIFVKRHRPQIKIMESLFINSFPQSNASILCTANEEAIYKRKPELFVAEIKDYYNRITHLYKRGKKYNVKILQTDIDINDSSRKLVEILKNIFAAI
jgi:hypothetical protein